MKKITDSRFLSFLVVTIVYAVATAVGLYTYRALPFDMWLNILIADVVATVVTFIFSLIFRNASVYDPYWSVQPIVILGAITLSAELSPLRIALLAAVMLWGVRLTANWAYTFHGLNHEDWRYVMLREKTGKAYPLINFLGIHMVPTLIVYECVLPGVYIMTEDFSENYYAFIPIAISVIAVIIQGTADIQMHKYRKNKDTVFNRNGLWKHSRHPNYLGEILMWWGVAATAVVVLPHMWYLCAGALANTLLFLFVSIPMAEKKQSTKRGYKKYKKNTRMLLPIKK